MILIHQVDRQMGQIEVFQRHRTDVIIVGNLHFIFVCLDAGRAGLRVCNRVIAGAGLRPVAGFNLHILRQRVLAVEDSLKQVAHLINRPFSLPERRQHGNQHIGVMFDLIQVKMVFVVIMGAFVIVQILLKLCLKRQILCLRRQHIRIGAGISGQHAGGCERTHHHGTAGHHSGNKQKHHSDDAENHKAFFVPGDKLNGFGGFLTGFLYGFGRSLGCLDRVVRSLSGLGLGIGFLNGALLLEPGDRACAPFRILKLRLLIQRLQIGPVGGAFCFQRSGIGFILQCAVGGIQCADTALGAADDLMGDRCGNAAVRVLMQFPVGCCRNRIERSGRCGMREFGRALFLGLLKNKARHDLIFLRVIDALFLNDFLFGDSALSLFQLLACFFRLSDGLLKLRRFQLLLCKQKAGRAFCHVHHLDSYGCCFVQPMISDLSARNTCLPLGVTSICVPRCPLGAINSRTTNRPLRYGRA